MTVLQRRMTKAFFHEMGRHTAVSALGPQADLWATFEMYVAGECKKVKKEDSIDGAEVNFEWRRLRKTCFQGFVVYERWRNIFVRCSHRETGACECVWYANDVTGSVAGSSK